AHAPPTPQRSQAGGQRQAAAQEDACAEKQRREACPPMAVILPPAASAPPRSTFPYGASLADPKPVRHRRNRSHSALGAGAAREFLCGSRRGFEAEPRRPGPFFLPVGRPAR